MNTIVWLPPLLFILHDMEEIIFAVRWKKKHTAENKEKERTFVPFGTFQTTESLSLGVYEELILLTLISLFSAASGHYELWLGFLAANILHLVLLHLIGTLILYRSYVPGAVTAAFTLIPCCMVFCRAIRFLHYPTWLLVVSLSLGIVAAAVNLKILHRCGKVFERYISEIFR